MKRVKGYLLTLVALMACPMWDSSDARIYLGEGVWCDVNNVYIPADPPLFPQGGYQTVVGNCLFSPPFPGYLPPAGGTPPPEPPIAGGTAPQIFLSETQIACAGEKASTADNPQRWAVTVDPRWAFTIPAASGVYSYSTTSSVPPPGYDIMLALTHNVSVNGQFSPEHSYTELFRAGYSAMVHDTKYHYVDPTTGQPATIQGLAADQHAVFVIAHEYAHQNGLGGTAENERDANQRGAQALEAYNTANRPCR